MLTKFGYAAEKLAAARRALLLPHPEGEARSIAAAFAECYLGLRGMTSDQFVGSAVTWFHTIRDAMNTAGVVDDSGRGLWDAKAQVMTLEDRGNFADAVDQLADHCRRLMHE